MAEPSPAAHVFEPSEQLAALDLGSNSFHLIVAHHHENRIQVIDRMKEMVRLAAGLDAHNVLTPEVTARALECLARFGQRLRHLPARNVRVVGTNTLRKARNSAAFLARAEEVLGHRIEVISGVEEARLIYLGVSFALEDSHDNKRLVIDIGGGSTELILGQQFEPRLMDSLYVGCVGLSAQYFPSGQLSSCGRHAMHFPLGLSQRGLAGSVHSRSSRHPRQTPRSTSHAPASGAQPVLPAEQPGLHVFICAAQRNPAGQSLSARQPTHLNVVRSHSGVAPEQAGTHSGFAPFG